MLRKDRQNMDKVAVFSYPLFRFSEKSARDQLVKKVTQETFQTTKELAEEIKRLQKQIGK